MMSRSFIILLTGLLVSSLAYVPVYAGNSWFSKERRQIDTSSRLARAANSTDSSKSIFDIVISLEANPQGDDKATTTTAGDENQRKYEEVIKEFADGICQATNTAHKLGIVRIFRNLEQKTSADILWNKQCASNQGPRAHPSGFGKIGQRIWMCDDWNSNLLIDQPKPAGFTLAHEWGHYAYGLYDEYVLKTGDTQSVPSIMTNQWCAAGGYACPTGFTSPDLDFLEFSTNQVVPFSGGGGTNSQLRKFGISAWDTLVQSTNNDPKCTVSNAASCVPSRTRYTNLAAVKPPSGSDYTVNNSEASCRDSLDIRWMQSDIINELVIDRSGSMGGTPLANAKIGASLLIDQLPDGKSAVGVASFAGNVTQDFAILDIPAPDTGVKTAAKTSVNSLNATGSTALYDGLQLGLDRSEAFAAASVKPDRVKVVYVLSDGGDNSSSATSASVIAAYQAAEVPIIALGYGAGAPTSVLQNLVSSTGGVFINSPTTLTEILQAFTLASTAVSSSVIINNSANSIPATSSFSQDLSIDSTLGDAFISLTYPGNLNDIDIVLLDPNGGNTGIGFTCETASTVIACSAKVDQSVILANPSGDYTLEITNNSATNLVVNSIVTATPEVGGDTYDIALGITGGSEVIYPQEARITATVSRDQLIAGLVVVATVTTPVGNTEIITLFDDGTHGDTFAQDGIYSALINYTMSGIHTVNVVIDNSAGMGVETTFGSALAPAPDGSSITPSLGAPIAEQFTRISSTQFNVVGFQADDHANDINSGNCTNVADDNTDTRGQIEFANDVDCFRVIPSDPNANLVFRVTGLSNNMIPVLSVFDSTGRELRQSISDGPKSGVVITIPNPDAAGLFFSVMHKEASAVIGGYDVSVGAKIFSDLNQNRQGVLNAKVLLEALQFDGKKDMKLLNNALLQINRSNHDALWNEDNETLTSSGDFWFFYIESAIGKLVKISDQTVVGMQIESLLGIASILAQEAIMLSGNERYQQKAQGLYNLAQDDMRAGDMPRALSLLKKSWSIGSR